MANCLYIICDGEGKEETFQYYVSFDWYMILFICSFTSCLLNIWVFKSYISRSLSYFIFFTLKNYCSSRTVYILNVHQFLLHSQYLLCHDFKMMIIIITITTIIIVTIIITVTILFLIFLLEISYVFLFFLRIMVDLIRFLPSVSVYL